MIISLMIFFMVVMDLFADKGLGGGKKAVWIIFLLPNRQRALLTPCDACQGTMP